MVNEEAVSQEVRKVMRRENMEPLHISAELFSPRGVINKHLKIEKDVSLVENSLNIDA